MQGPRQKRKASLQREARSPHQSRREGRLPLLPDPLHYQRGLRRRTPRETPNPEHPSPSLRQPSLQAWRLDPRYRPHLPLLGVCRHSQLRPQKPPRTPQRSPNLLRLRRALLFWKPFGIPATTLRHSQTHWTNSKLPSAPPQRLAQQQIAPNSIGARLFE